MPHRVLPSARTPGDGGPKLPSGFDETRAAYRGRGYAVGSFAFGPEADLETVGALASAFIRAFVPSQGLRVRVSRGERIEVLPATFTRTASVGPKQLARGGSVELTAGDFDVPKQGLPIFWVTNEPPILPDPDDIPLRVGFCFVRPRTEKAELAVAHAMTALAEAAVEVDGCLSAVVGAQDAPLSLTNDALPYETLAGTTDRATEGTWLRTHARSPAWRVLVPRSEIRSLSRPPPEDVTLQRCASGLLVQVDTDTPFAIDASGAFEEIERWLLPVLGVPSGTEA